MYELKKNEIHVGCFPRIDENNQVVYDEHLIVTVKDKSINGYNYKYHSHSYSTDTLDKLYVATMVDIAQILKNKPGAIEKFIKIVTSENDRTTYHPSFVKFINQNYDKFI